MDNESGKKPVNIRYVTVTAMLPAYWQSGRMASRQINFHGVSAV